MTSPPTKRRRKDESWKVAKFTLAQRGAYLLETGIFSDVQFLVGKGNNVRIMSAHKLFLSIESNMFATMMKIPGLREDEPIPLPDITPLNFFRALGYIYTHQLYLEDLEEALQVYDVALKYSIPSLQKECRKYFPKAKLHPETVCRVFEIAKFLSIESLWKRCMIFILDSTAEVLRSKAFRNANQETVQMILTKSQVSTASKCELFIAVLAWGRTKCSRQNLEDNFTNIRTFLNPLVPYIRNLKMSIKEFTKAVDDAEGVFDRSQMIDFYLKIM